MMNQLMGMMTGNQGINPMQMLQQNMPQEYQQLMGMVNGGQSPNQIIEMAMQRNPQLAQTQLGPILNEMKGKSDINELRQYAESVWPHISQQMGIPNQN